MTKVRLREKKVDISTGKIATDFQAREGWRRRLGNLSLVASREWPPSRRKIMKQSEKQFEQHSFRPVFSSVLILSHSDNAEMSKLNYSVAPAVAATEPPPWVAPHILLSLTEFDAAFPKPKDGALDTPPPPSPPLNPSSTSPKAFLVPPLTQNSSKRSPIPPLTQLQLGTARSWASPPSDPPSPRRSGCNTGSSPTK